MSFSKREFDTVVVRFAGEIGIKAAWTRKLYERRLIANIKAVLKHHNLSYTRIVRKFGRLYIKTSQAEETAEKLGRVFGVSSLSPALETTSNLNSIIDVSISTTRGKFKKGKSFAVRCHRVGKHSYTSQEVCRQVGHKILDSFPELDLQVDLTRPEQTLQIEVREDKAYVFTDTVKGVGGLPLGTQPKTLCLLKGDVFSMVACWMTMKRGSPPLLVHFENDTSPTKVNSERVLNTAQKLMEWSTGFPKNRYIIEYKKGFQKISQIQPPILNNLLFKRLMFRVAQSIARMKNAEGIVTGEMLGIKASQKLHIFKIEDEVAREYPIYRPLLGLDTSHIEEIARRIGLEETALYELESEEEISKARMPVLKLEDIKRTEKKLNIEKMVEEALKSLRVEKI